MERLEREIYLSVSGLIVSGARVFEYAREGRGMQVESQCTGQD